MNDSQQPARPPTRRQLRAVVHKIAHIYLEVERGLRPPGHLAAFLTDREYRRHRILPPDLAPGRGPVRPHDIGPIHLTSTASGRIHASVLLRRDTDRWSALVVGLDHVCHTWKVDKLDRLEHLRRGLQWQQAIHVPDEDIGRCIRLVEEELLLAKAAKRAVENRLDGIGDRRTKAARAATAERDRWVGRAAEREGELADLRGRQQLRHQHDLIEEADVEAVNWSGQIGCDVDPEVPGPGGAHVASIRDTAARELLGYRQRWNLRADVPPLAAPIESVEQAADRQRLIEHLRGAFQELKADDHLKTDGIARERDVALELEP